MELWRLYKNEIWIICTAYALYSTTRWYFIGIVKWGASSRWSSSLNCPMRNTDEMTIGKRRPTLQYHLSRHPIPNKVWFLRIAWKELVPLFSCYWDFALLLQKKLADFKCFWEAREIILTKSSSRLPIIPGFYNTYVRILKIRIGPFINLHWIVR